MITRASSEYLDRIKIGTIVAFKTANMSKAFSGKIEEIHRDEYVVETKNGIRYTVEPEHIIWVKTTDRWPRAIHNQFLGLDSKGEHEVGKWSTATA